MRFFANHKSPRNDNDRQAAILPVDCILRRAREDLRASAHIAAFSAGLPDGVGLEGLAVTLDGTPAPFETAGESAIRFDAADAREVRVSFNAVAPWDYLLAYGEGLDFACVLELDGETATGRVHDPMQVVIPTALGLQVLAARPGGPFRFSPLMVEPGGEFVARIRYQREAAYLTKNLIILFALNTALPDTHPAGSWWCEYVGVDTEGALAATCEPRVRFANAAAFERGVMSHEHAEPFTREDVWSDTPDVEPPFVLGLDLRWRDANGWRFYLNREEEIHVDVHLRVPADAAEGAVCVPVSVVASHTLVESVGEQENNVDTFDLAYLPAVMCSKEV